MNTPPTPRLKVIGVGNAWRGDDAVGLLVVRRLKAGQPPEVEIAECRGTVTAVREAWKDAAGVIVVDAVVSGGHPGAIYRFDAKVYATDGLCTHEQVHLADGLVMGHLIECPKHNGQFDYRTGEAKRAPVCVNLKTFPVKVEGDRVLVQVG